MSRVTIRIPQQPSILVYLALYQQNVTPFLGFALPAAVFAGMGILVDYRNSK